MEWSLHIATPAELTSDASLPDDLAAIFGNVRFTRIAYGTEFCENLIPSRDSLRAVAASGRPLTFLTPYAGDEGIANIRALLPELPAGSEVVFNDWGVLRMLRRDFTHLVPVQGRLLNKSLRDPRVTGVYAETAADQAASALKILQRSNLDNPEYLDLLARFDVRSVEMDNLPQGTDTSFATRGVSVALYLPFGFIATSRVCMAAGLHYRKADKFQPGASCRHECQSHQLEYTYSNSPFSNRDQKFLLKGNTYFYHQSEPMLRRLADQVARGSIARLVYQPRLPMFFG